MRVDGWGITKAAIAVGITAVMMFHWSVVEAEAEPFPCIVATESTVQAPAENILFAERVPDGYWESAGKHRITHYCPENCCNPGYAWQTASQAPMVVGRTVAASAREFPFGTKLLINGTIYTVEDRGVGAGCVDILCNSHSEALDRGKFYTEVFVWRDYPITDGAVINDLEGGRK